MKSIFLGKEELKKVRSDGIKKKLMGIKLDAKEVSLSGSLDLKDEEDNIIGELRSACYSPHFEKVIGIAMIKKPYWEVSQGVKAEINGNICTGIVCDLPFI
ncbi:glycine cleavage T C-terminal barrel domain-containing protein [Candidatus Pelagibacter sp.]|nr:glycine cleavage T C-terminal barrel domain-containing protein [Candidatus Pelagibacter sp.]